MITCNLKGGLGNQLFQIYATIVYALKRGDKFFFTNENVLKIGIERKTYWNDFLISLKPFTRKLNNNQFLLLGHNEHHYVDLKNYNVSNIILDGYFQSYKYFIEYEKQIFSLMQLTEKQELIKNEFYFYLNHIYSIRTVSIHFRLGDYKYKQEYHNILTLDYYKKAISELIEKNEHPIKILYFCEKEDNNFVIENYINHLKHEKIQEFVKIPDEIPDWKQLLIMSCCDDNIIANSSFSWWGAYFPNPDKTVNKTVYYPTQWFGPKMCNTHKTHDMFPESWVKI
jgi:hypothetical protein